MRNTLRYAGVDYTDATMFRAAQIARSAALNSRVLDVDTMTVSVKSASDLSPVSQNSRAYFFRGGSPYAAWNVRTVTRIAPKAWSLAMESPFGELARMPHRGGIYNGVAASTILTDICGDVPYSIDSVFENVLLYGFLPYVSPSGEAGALTGSAKDNLLKVIFALNASVWADADTGALRIANLSTSVSASIDADRIYRDNARVLYEAPVTSVTVLEHQYISGGDLATLFEGTTIAGQTIVFPAPMSNLSATGFTIVESGANYAVVSAGAGALTGQKYIHTTREITRTVTSAPVQNLVRVEDATLVSITNSSEVANRLADYYAHRAYIECDAVLNFERPGAVISLYDPFDKVMRNACIEKISPIVVSGVLKGRISALVGFTPWQTRPFEDVRVLLTSAGTWTVPAGVTELTVVQIGGGQGGEEGKRGEAPKKIGSQSYTDQTWVPNYYVTIQGIQTTHEPTTDGAGAGGLPGAPGAGGNILISTLSVTPGQQISYSCGAGGAGAVFGSGQPGTLGTSTVFGTLTSANGQPYQNGFLDVMTQTIYGRHGDTGIPGGKGCSYGDPEPPAIVWNGVPYHAGAVNLERLEVRDSSNEFGTFVATNYSTFGGGAAAGGNGSDGDYCSLSAYASSSSGYAQAYPISGGAGGNAQKPLPPTIYGQGGTGGNGGGGRGDYGRVRAETRYNKDRNPRAPGRLVMTVQEPLPGGAGSDGGDGADGCIILYYRVPITE